MTFRLTDPDGVSVSSRLADERSRKSVPDLITLQVNVDQTVDIPDALVRFRSMSITAPHVTLP